MSVRIIKPAQWLFTYMILAFLAGGFRGRKSSSAGPNAAVEMTSTSTVAASVTNKPVYKRVDTTGLLERREEDQV